MLSVSANVNSGSDSTLVRVFEHSGVEDNEIFQLTISVKHVGNVGPSLAAASLLPCMALKQPIEIRHDLPLSMRPNFNTAQEILKAWCPRLEHTAIAPSTWSQDEKSSRRCEKALFFSGGVDSFYSLIRGHEDISFLVFVHGFDIQLSDHERRRSALRLARETASEVGITLVEVETNLREWIGQYVNWSLAHGLALISVAHLLSELVGEIWISATHSFPDLFPWGSHPLLDPLFSTSNLKIVHYGCEATRQKKIEVLAEWQWALRRLRVCYIRSKGKMNCGACQKCLRTRLGLWAAGVLHLCETFEPTISETEAESLRIEALGELAFVSDIIDRLESAGTTNNLTIILRQKVLDFWIRPRSHGRELWNPFSDSYPLAERT